MNIPSFKEKPVMKSQWGFNVFDFFILLLCFISITLATSESHDEDDLSACLNLLHLTNFTLRSDEYHLRRHLISLQNLRFHRPKPPTTRPLAIISPSSYHKVAAAVRCCTAASLRILVRSGGHSYEGLSSTTNSSAHFAIIDMSSLNRVTVDPLTDTAWVEGGATLGETYYAIAQSSPTHAFPGCSCPTVGISGLVSGGGFGFLSRKHGLAADNVVDAILVDALGRELDRAAMGEDVFWALRGGGGGNWGIVTVWKIRLIRIPETVTAFTVKRQGKTETISMLVNKWQFIGPRLNDEFYLSVTLGTALNTPSVTATFQGLFLGNKERAMAIMEMVFPELELNMDEYKEMSWIDSIVEFSGLPNGSSLNDLRARFGITEKHHFKAKSDYVRNPIPVEALKKMMEILEDEPQGLVIMDPYGGIMDQIPSDSIAFPHRKGNLFSMQYVVTWEEGEEDEEGRCIDWIRGLYPFMEAYVSSNPRAAYVNYLDLDLGVAEEEVEGYGCGGVERGRRWGEKYYLGNYEKLVRVKTMIDPDNVFRHQQSVPPLQSSYELSGDYAWSSCRCAGLAVAGHLL